MVSFFFHVKGSEECNWRHVSQKISKEMEISLRRNRAFLSKIPFGRMRGLVKAALTSNRVGFNSVPSAPSRRIHMLHRIVDARRGVEPCLPALGPRQGHGR